MRKLHFKKQTNTFDNKLLFLALGLTFFGIVAIADASSPIALRDFSDKFYFAKQQVIWAVIGILLLFVFSKIKYTFWQKFATSIFIVSLIALFAVLLPSIGTRILGAKRWIVLGGVTFQPSEFVKLSMAIYLAKIASRKMKPLAYILPIVLVSILIMLQPDLGTTLVIAAEALTQLFISGISISFLVGGAVVGSLSSLLLIITSAYRKERLLTFLKQTSDPLGSGYHIRQILLALGSGGLLGVGLGKSRQKYLFLPETATDSIFAIIAEEIGFIGAGLLILIFAIFIFRGIRIARNAPDAFSQILSFGIIGWIGFQFFLNIGSMVALVPLTGIPLPFISYGGSSLIVTLCATGILLNISKYGQIKK